MKKHHFKKHILNTKFIFTFVVGVIIFLVIMASVSLKYNNIFTKENFSRISGYYKYQLVNFKDKNPNLFNRNYYFEANDLPQNQTALSIPVLVYHGITNKSDRFNMTEEIFRDQMLTLKKAGYTTITAGDFVAYMKNEKELPDRSFLLTFDDGRKDSYYGADPVLRALDFNAIMFIATNFSLPENDNYSSYYLNEKELKQMESTGRWEIGSHLIQEKGGYITIDASGTKGNFLSNKTWIADMNRLETDQEYAARVYKELSLSKEIIEQKLGHQVKIMSLPFGDYGQQSINNPNSIKVIRENLKKNYDIAFHQIWPIDKEFSHNYARDDHYMEKRIEPSPDWQGGQLLSYLETGHSKALPFVDYFEKDNGWKTSWGNLRINKNNLSIGSNAKTSGGFAFLDGGFLWSNYLVTAKMNWNSGSHVFLISRLRDDENYISCVFNDSVVSIRTLDSHKNTEIHKVKMGYLIPKKDVELGMSIDNGNVNCIIDGNIILSGRVSAYSTGGVAFKTWDEDGGESNIEIKSVIVEPINNDVDDLVNSLEKKKLLKN